MCTAVTYKSKDFYFGRTLDYEFSYGESITITPRGYLFPFRHLGAKKAGYAIIGMAHVANGYPLYYDAVNEKGLAVAGLNFVGNAYYSSQKEGKTNVAQFELIPWLLSSFCSLAEAKEGLKKVHITNTPFSSELGTSSLHWLIADSTGAITVEAVAEGVRVYDNPVGVLTNNPPFPVQLSKLADYRSLSAKTPENTFSPTLSLSAYSRGMGAIGLPGDLSSSSRFVRAAFVKANSISKKEEGESVSQFFHILGSVEQQRGCCEVAEGKYEITIYTSCCNADKGIYYYTTYSNRRIRAVDMHRENLDGERLISYPLGDDGEDILFKN